MPFALFIGWHFCLCSHYYKPRSSTRSSCKLCHIEKQYLFSFQQTHHILIFPNGFLHCRFFSTYLCYIFVIQYHNFIQSVSLYIIPLDWRVCSNSDVIFHVWFYISLLLASAKRVMFWSCLFVCLFVCPCAGLLKKVFERNFYQRFVSDQKSIH